MGVIKKTFCDAYKKRSFLWLMLVLPPVFLLSIRIFGYFFEASGSLLLAAIIIVLLISIRNILIRSSGFLEKRILKAFWKSEQYDEFLTTIENELHYAGTKAKTISNEKIFICVTESWFILVTPNGALICKRCDIKQITSAFRETNSKHYLKVVLSDKQSFLFPYPELEELLIEWNQMR